MEKPNPDVIVDEDGTEWMLLAAALPLFPSSTPGKLPHINSVRRMIKAGRLSGRQRRQGRRKIWYVCLEEVRALRQLEPIAVNKLPPAAERRKVAAWTEKVLERMRPKGRAKAVNAGVAGGPAAPVDVAGDAGRAVGGDAEHSVVRGDGVS
jgi:hypothetical protein